jgi:hypothetical protein
MQEFMKSIQRIDEAIQIYHTKSSDKYSHIDQSEIEKANKILTDKQNWYDQTANRFNALKLHEDSAILCSQIKQERDVSVIFETKYFHSTPVIDLRLHLSSGGVFKRVYSPTVQFYSFGVQVYSSGVQVYSSEVQVCSSGVQFVVQECKSIAPECKSVVPDFI